MAAYNKFNQYVADLHHGVHDWSADTFKVALCAAANAPQAGNSVLADLTTISVANLVAGGDTLVLANQGQTAGLYQATVDDLVVAAGPGGPVGPFRYVAVYNSSVVDNPLVAWYDLGEDVTIAAGQSVTFNFDQANGLFRTQ